MEETTVKTGHPVLGIVLGIIGILVALCATFLFGAYGGGIALLLGVIAIVIGISAHKKGGKGKGAIIIGVIAVVLACAMTFGIYSTFKSIREQAVKAESAPLVEKYLDKPWLGFYGIIDNLSKASQEEQQEFSNQLNQLIGTVEETVPDAVPAE